MRRPTRAPASWLRTTCVVGLLGATACAGNDMEGSFGDGWGPGGGAGGADAGMPGAPDEDPSPEPLALSVPVRSGSWLFLANPARGTVAKLAFESGRPRIATIATGVPVASLAPLGDAGRVAALDETGTTLLVIEAAPLGEPDVVFRAQLPAGTDTLTPLADGSFLLAWDDADDGSSGAGVSSVTLVRTSAASTPVAVSVAVGAFPYEVRPTTEGTFLVLSLDGVSTLDPRTIDRNTIAPPYRLTDEGVDNRVRASADGRLLVRLELGDEPAVRVDAPLGRDEARVPLPSPPGQFALASTTDLVFVTLPEIDEVALIDLRAWPEEAPSVRQISVETGRRDLAVTDDGRGVLLFRAGQANAEILDPATGESTRVDTDRAITNALIVPGEQLAVLLHGGAEAPGFTLADFDAAFAKRFDTSAPVLAIAWAPTSGTLLLLTSDDASGTLHVVARDSLVGRTVSLRHRPIALGALDAENVAWVMESHPYGRISFVDVTTREVATVTGFELNSLIE